VYLLRTRMHKENEEKRREDMDIEAGPPPTSYMPLLSPAVLPDNHSGGGERGSACVYPPTIHEREVTKPWWCHRHSYAGRCDLSRTRTVLFLVALCVWPLVMLTCQLVMPHWFKHYIRWILLAALLTHCAAIVIMVIFGVFGDLTPSSKLRHS
jgi:hypothetical protein